MRSDSCSTGVSHCITDKRQEFVLDTSIYVYKLKKNMKKARTPYKTNRSKHAEIVEDITTRVLAESRILISASSFNMTNSGRHFLSF
jgi:hypothetical protein